MMRNVGTCAARAVKAVLDRAASTDRLITNVRTAISLSLAGRAECAPGMNVSGRIV